jgi:hypothetical protein
MLSPSKGRPTIRRGANTRISPFGRPGRWSAWDRIRLRLKPRARFFSGRRESLRGTYSGSEPGCTGSTEPERATRESKRDLERCPLAKLASGFAAQAAEHRRSDFEGQASRHEIGRGFAEKFSDRCAEFSRSAFRPVQRSGDFLLKNLHPLFGGRRVHLLPHLGLRGAPQCARRAVEARDDPARDRPEEVIGPRRKLLRLRL